MEVVGHTSDQFDVSSATTVFWDTVPVLLQRPDREDVLDELSVRLLSGHTKHSVNLKVLRMHICKESDLLFLHTLEVSEEDFQTLKAEQGILVDFANFSGKIIDLLRRCIASKGEDVPRFRGVLALSAGESIFKMVETNDFKQLAHISLCFRPGTDMAVKSYLAFRLNEVQQERDTLSSDLAARSEALRRAQADLSQRQEALRQVEASHTRLMLEQDATGKDAAARMLEAHMQEKKALTAAHEEEKRALQEEHERRTRGSQERAAELDKENRELRDGKYALEARVAELGHKCGSSASQAASLSEEVTRLQRQLHDVSSSKTQADVELADLRGKLAAHADKVAMQDAVIQQQRARAQDLEGSVKQLDARCAELREAGAAHEHRAAEATAELSRSSHAVERLTADLQTSRDKLKRKQLIIVRQEEELQEREAASARLTHSLQELQREHTAALAEAAAAGAANDELRGKLDDCAQQLKGNEQMIRWLNAQVNEAQLAATRPTGAASRYTFKPSIAGSSLESPLPYAPRSHTPGTAATQPPMLTGGAAQTPVPFSTLSNGATHSPSSRVVGGAAGFMAGKVAFRSPQQPSSIAASTFAAHLSGR